MRSLAFACIPILLALAAAADEPPVAKGEASEPEAHALLDRSFRNLYGGDFIQKIEMTSRGRGSSVRRELQIVRKESEPPGRAMVRFLSPPEERGTSMLVIERQGRTDDVFVYLPALARTRRISTTQRFDSFFGTNFTYEDLEPKEAKDFHVRAEGTLAIDGIRCTKLHVTPREGVESRYDHTLTCIEPERAVALWTEYYRGGRLLKRLEADPAKIQPFDDRHIPTLLLMTDDGSDFTTAIVTETHESRDTIPERLFSMTNLEAGDEDSDLRLSGPGAAKTP